MIYENLFELKDYHLKLLDRAYFEYRDTYEWGHVGFGGKRPFGNSDLVNDMAEILGEPMPDEDSGEYADWPPEDVYDRMLAIYEQELPHALAIVVQHGRELGRYVSRDICCQKWEKL